MGKKQHQKDKMYLTTTEWTNFYGGYKASSHTGAQANFRRLPLTHCTLSLLPFSHPFCDEDGNIFDLEALLPFLKKFKVNPVTGKAVDQLNIKAKNWRDLLTDESFTRADIITIQCSDNLDKFNISLFHHIKNELKIEDEELVKSRSDSSLRLKSVSQDTKMILDEFNRTYKDTEDSGVKEERVADKFNAAHFSTGKVAASFTSTTMNVETEHQPAVLEDDFVRYKRVKKKGYVSLKTNFGILNLEVYCDTVPKTSENFLRLCEKGYYNGTKFHRSIRHFMIQGGDPTGTGNGGDSFWGGPFKDEIKPNYSHKGRGVLSMANSGPDTNKSQFFMTFRSCPHLDGKHTIFGRVVGGLSALSAIEAVETDNKDRPIEDITLVATVVFVDPFREADDELAKERQEEMRKRQMEEDELKSVKRPKKGSDAPKVFREGVGKFLDLSQTSISKEELPKAPPQPKKKKDTTNFSDFSCFS